MRMDYAMKSLSLLCPRSLARCPGDLCACQSFDALCQQAFEHVAVSTSVVRAQQLVSEANPEASRARPCRVSTADRRVRKGVTACSLEDLLRKVQDILMLKNKPFSLVLEEDGTAVETEGYFQALAGNTVFMVLQKGQRWQPPLEQGTQYQLSLSDKPSKKIDVARVTFDLYKLSPQDFIGCLNVKATLYDTYSLSYDLHCYKAKRIVKEVLRWALFGMRATGHLLLGTSCYVEQLLDVATTEEVQPAQARASSLLAAGLKLLP